MIFRACALLFIALAPFAAVADEAGQPRWIWGDPASEGQVVLFRRVIEIDGPVAAASVVASCDNQMVIWVNGEMVLRSDNWERAVRGDLKRHLREGRNVVAVRGQNSGGPAGLVAEIEYRTESGETTTVVSNADWQVLARPYRGWQTDDAGNTSPASVVADLGGGSWPSVTYASFQSARVPREITATPADQVTVAEGFEVELLYSVPKAEQGSWVSLTSDPQGRLIASDQYGKMYRITPPAVGSGETPEIETLDIDLGFAHGLLYAHDSLYVVASEREQGLYRVRDTDGDDQFDDVQLLRSLRGSGEHGPHAVILSPDGRSLYVCGGNHTDLPSPEKSVVPPVWDEDQLLPRMWDAGGHAVGKLAPGGWICRTDLDGKEFELVSAGYRNQFDIAFNADGELFTFDADMEWDIGSPWYRPTRVNHATSGSEFGWRSGTGKWPEFYPDSLPAVIDIGPGSPTGIAFGYHAQFPAKYQRALYLCDWSYGKLFAVHLEADGSTYQGTSELFATASPLALTDVIINPVDGAMYFATGGRRTQSGLYRVTYQGDESTAPADLKTDEGRDLRALRHRLEALHHEGADDAITEAWPYLAHDDRFVRFAARVAIEHQAPERWQHRVPQETRPQAAIEATLAVARCGSSEATWAAVGHLTTLDVDALSTMQQLALLRAYGLAAARHGEPSAEVRDKILAQVDARYPGDNPTLNQELARVLIYLAAPNVVERTVQQLELAETQEEEVTYGLFLRTVTDGWTLDLRRKYFEWFLTTGSHRGGHSFQGFLNNIRNEAQANVPEDAAATLAELISQPIQPADPIGEPREFVQEWTVEDLLDDAMSLENRNFEQGERMFAAASCFKCHRVRGRGGIVGPDLTGVGRRFDMRYLLEASIEPNKVISDQYAATVFVTENGQTIVGRVANLSGDNLRIITNMLEPGNMTTVNRNTIEEQLPSRVSMMPEELLNTLSRDEILDLLAYLKSGGDPEDPIFSSPATE